MPESSLYDVGWRQGAVFDAELPAYWLDFSDITGSTTHEQRFHRWVVCTQDCDLAGTSVASAEPLIELRPVLDVDTPDSWGIRSRRVRLTNSWHVDASLPRTAVTAVLLNLNGPPSLLSDERALAFKTWLGLRYDRPAVPERLVDLAREVARVCGTTSGRATAETVHEVLMQFNESAAPPQIALFAVVADDADRDAVRMWLADSAARVDSALGVVAHIDVGSKSETSLALLETSYSADLSQLTWRGEAPTGTT